MVQSRLNVDVNYKEKRGIESEDMDYLSPVYELGFFKTPIVITIGKIRSALNITYFPMYIIKDDAIRSQIGVFEIAKSTNLFDEDRDIDLSKITPLFYDFVDQEFIDKTESNIDDYLAKAKMPENAEEKQPEKAEEKQDEAEESDEDDVFAMPAVPAATHMATAKTTLTDGIFTSNHINPPPNLPEESKEQADAFKHAFHASPTNKWIQNFMQNQNYDILEVESNGDCLFATIRDAFKQIGQITTVKILRALLATQITDEIYQEYRKVYSESYSVIKNYEAEIKQLTYSLTDLKKRHKTATDKAELTELVKESKKQSAQLNKLKHDLHEANDGIELVSFIKDIKDIDEYREYMQTSSFWADTWAISTLENLLNIKLIILSEKSFKDGALPSVLNCGEINQNTDTFSPKYYIMTTYSGNHYRLISYKHKNIFTFSEIPYDIKALVINKCMERNSGAFYLITDFRNLQTRIGAHPAEPEEEMPSDLFDSDIVFMFHKASDKSSKPGKGSNEKIPKEKATMFIELARQPNWRRTLDNDWSAPFTLDGHRWQTVNHYMYGAKFKKGFPDQYLQFSLDSDSELSKDVDVAKKTAADKSKLRDKKIIPDADYEHRRISESKNALHAKFSQNLDLKHILLLTQPAKLIHYERTGVPAETDNTLMEIRRDLN